MSDRGRYDEDWRPTDDCPKTAALAHATGTKWSRAGYPRFDHLTLNRPLGAIELDSLVYGVVDNLFATGNRDAERDADAILASLERELLEGGKASPGPRRSTTNERAVVMHGAAARQRVEVRRAVLGRTPPRLSRGATRLPGGVVRVDNTLGQPSRRQLSYAPDGVLVVDGVRAESVPSWTPAQRAATAGAAVSSRPAAQRRQGDTYNVYIGPDAAPSAPAPAPGGGTFPNGAPGTGKAKSTVGHGWTMVQNDDGTWQAQQGGDPQQNSARRLRRV